MKKIFSLLVFCLLFIFCGGILFASIRGNFGNPKSTELTQQEWQQNGPFELSPERGRFALTYSIVEDKSFFFSLPLARFVVPDLGYVNGKYVSLFAPAISYLVVPGYIIGKYFGASQVGAFVGISLFAFINMLLIQKISTKLGVSKVAGILGSLAFLFATPAYAYAVTLYQHHVSTFLILFSIYILISTTSILPLFFVWFLCAMSIPVEYPNFFLMFPIGIYAVFRFFYITRDTKKSFLHFRIFSPLTFIGVVLPLAFFLWFNKASYGNPLQLSGTIQSVNALDAEGKPTRPLATGTDTNLEKFFNPELQQRSAVRFFQARNLINGFYEHIISADRGIIYFTPVILFGILGLVVLYRRKNPYMPLLTGVILANLLLYSMWGDPYGGWAFGSRYLIPAYAVLGVALAVGLDALKRYWVVLLLFLVVLAYSIGVNTVGALTTSANPPKTEVLALEKLSGRQEKYTYERNIDFLYQNGSKSFAYNTWFKKYVNPVQYFWIIAGTLTGIATIATFALIFSKPKTDKQ
jgi:hypothetical protein